MSEEFLIKNTTKEQRRRSFAIHLGLNLDVTILAVRSDMIFIRIISMEKRNLTKLQRSSTEVLFPKTWDRKG